MTITATPVTKNRPRRENRCRHNFTGFRLQAPPRAVRPDVLFHAPPRTSGGTGRRTGFRFRRVKPYRFKSCLVHLSTSLREPPFVGGAPELPGPDFGPPFGPPPPLPEAPES